MDMCNNSWYGFCLCPNSPTFMRSHDATFYAKAGCFRIGRSLYSARSYGYTSRHFWQSFIHLPSGHRRRISVMPRGFVLYFDISISELSVLKHVERPFINGVLPMIHVWRVQRAIKRFLREKLARRVAFMMSAHPRLGSSSTLACIPPELLHKILRFNY